MTPLRSAPWLRDAVEAHHWGYCGPAARRALMASDPRLWRSWLRAQARGATPTPHGRMERGASDPLSAPGGWVDRLIQARATPASDRLYSARRLVSDRAWRRTYIRMQREARPLSGGWLP